MLLKRVYVLINDSIRVYVIFCACNKHCLVRFVAMCVIFKAICYREWFKCESQKIKCNLNRRIMKKSAYANKQKSEINSKTFILLRLKTFDQAFAGISLWKLKKKAKFCKFMSIEQSNECVAMYYILWLSAIKTICTKEILLCSCISTLFEAHAFHRTIKYSRMNPN